MNHYFYKKVDKRSRTEMINFLENHFRYFTMNYWNRSTSYANCVKLYKFQNIPENAYEMLAYFHHSPVFEIEEDFAMRYNYCYQIDFNGHSGGYIVLYQGGIKENGRTYIQPGHGIDEDADFEDWTLEELRERVNLIQDFDLTCDEIVNAYFEFCKTHKIEERAITRLEPVCVPA